LALAAIAAPYLIGIREKLAEKKKFPFAFKTFVIVFLLGAIGLTALNCGKSRRDGEMLEDVNKVGNYVPQRITMGAEEAVFDLWNLKFYLMRYHGISLSLDLEYEYLLFNKGAHDPIMQYWKLVDIDLVQFDLWQRMDN
jgi:hypothetical protein